jgi:PPM family protein phosphatase
MEIRPGIALANLSDVGLVRENNEDYYCYAEPEGAEDFAKRGRLAIIADGMGGYEGGQFASRIAVDTVRETYLKDLEADPLDALLEGFRLAHQRILAKARESEELEGMGTTCTALIILGTNLQFAHVGDSRLYLLRGPNIFQLTRDHSYVNKMVEAGMLTPEEAEHHPQKNVLMMALGASKEIRADCPADPLPLQPGDTLLMCTDGLSGLVSNEEMQQAVNGSALEKGCKDLIELAKSRGGHDNITVQLLRVASDSMRKTQVDGVKAEPPAPKPGDEAAAKAGKEPKAPSKKSEAGKEPEAAKKPEASKEAEADKKLETSKEPEASKESESSKEPEAGKKPEGSKDPEA